MSSSFPQQFWKALSGSWRDRTTDNGAWNATSLLLNHLWTFLRESTPAQRRQRYGDMEYDWDNRVNTTSGVVSWQARLLGLFHSPYQPTEPALFQEMMAALPLDFREFTFIDVGSGKGRTLLMASEYPFQKIVGVELIEELHRAAVENILEYRSPTQQCSKMEPVRADASDFVFPDTPLVLYLFNPLPEPGLRRLIRNLEQSLEQTPRTIWIVYHNPAMDSILTASPALVRAGGTDQYAMFSGLQRL